jgi:hypothetical protein
MTESTTPGHPSPRRWKRWLVEVAVVAAAFFAVHAFVTRDVVRGPLPALAGVMADGTPMRVAGWQATLGGEAFLLYVWAA